MHANLANPAGAGLTANPYCGSMDRQRHLYRLQAERCGGFEKSAVACKVHSEAWAL